MVCSNQSCTVSEISNVEADVSRTFLGQTISGQDDSRTDVFQAPFFAKTLSEIGLCVQGRIWEEREGDRRGLGDGSPPVGSRGKAPVGGLGEDEDTFCILIANFKCMTA